MVFDTATGKPLVEAGDKSPMFAKLGNSGRYAVTTGIGAPFALVDARQNKVLWKTSGSDTPAMTFGPNDRLVAFSFDKTTHVVQPATGKEVARLDRSAKVLAQGFNQDESLLAISSDDKVVRIHDAFNGRERVRIPQDDRVHALAFAPGNLIATGSALGSLRIFDALSGREVSHMPYAIPVMKLQFSRDGRYLLTLGVRPESESLAARIFDVATVRELWATTLSREAFGSAASFADNDRAVVSYAAFQMQRHLWRAEDLIAEACARLDRNLTEAEWRQYLGDEPYRKTCPGR
jgi:WD40 repeat protein